MLRAPSGISFLAFILFLFFTLASLVLLHEAQNPRPKPTRRAEQRCQPVHFAYPVVVGVVEALAQLAVIAFSRMLFLSLGTLMGGFAAWAAVCCGLPRVAAVSSGERW